MKLCSRFYTSCSSTKVREVNDNVDVMEQQDYITLLLVLKKPPEEEEAFSVDNSDKIIRNIQLDKATE